MILVIDNYDSFTYNLVQYLGELGADVRVRRNDQVTVGEIEMSMASRTVTCADQLVDLTSVEFNVLELLLRNAGNVVTRDQIAEVALGRQLNPFDRSVDVHVSRLRKKLGSLAGSDDLIRPIRGIGYFMPATTPERSHT